MLINNIRKSPTFPIRNTIHAPTRGATPNCRIFPSINSFNPRSYKRSDQCIFYCIRRFNLSIHVPTRGATIFKFRFRIVFLLSIHAPTRGATVKTRMSHTLNLSFNPRSYKRSDATNSSATSKIRTFNPRSYKRSDPCTSSLCSGMLLFQSTLLQEERQQKCTIFLMHLCNNYCIVSI